jgi:hypothetical protein
MKRFDEWIDRASIPKPPASWTRHGERSFESSLHLILPSESELHQIARTFPLPAGQVLQLSAFRTKVSNDPVLAGLFRVYHTVLFLEKDASDESYENWPIPMSLRDQEASLFRALVILSGTEIMEGSLAKRGLSEWQQFCRNEYLHATRMHFELHGVYGLQNGSMWWLWPVFLGRVFRLGRLTYEIGFYASSWHVFAHKDGSLLILAGDLEQRYDEGGLESINGIYQPTYRESGNQVVGNGFDGNGFYIPEPFALDLSVWSRVVKTGDPILSLHIPGDGKLDPDEVKASIKLAAQFFVRWFPDLPLRLVTCHSWLLNTQLSELLPSGSNILAFQKWFTLALANPNNEALFSFVFDVPPCPLDQLLPKTEFQKRLLAYVCNGGMLRDGFGVFSI